MSAEDGDIALADVTADFLDRMERGARQLEELADSVIPIDGPSKDHRARLKGKAQGVRLAMSYWRDAVQHAELVARNGGPVNLPREQGEHATCSICGAVWPCSTHSLGSTQTGGPS